jgi:hypothetical protein
MNPKRANGLLGKNKDNKETVKKLPMKWDNTVFVKSEHSSKAFNWREFLFTITKSHFY